MQNDFLVQLPSGQHGREIFFAVRNRHSCERGRLLSGREIARLRGFDAVDFHHSRRTCSVICHYAKRNLNVIVAWLPDRLLDSPR